MALFRGAVYPAARGKQRDKSLLFNAGVQAYNPESLILDLVFMGKKMQYVNWSVQDFRHGVGNRLRSFSAYLQFKLSSLGVSLSPQRNLDFSHQNQRCSLHHLVCTG